MNLKIKASFLKAAIAVTLGLAAVVGAGALAGRAEDPGGSASFVTPGQNTEYKDRLTSDGRGIVRHPGPLVMNRGALDRMPSFDQSKSVSFQVDLRGFDLRALDLTGRLPDLFMADFDVATRWPATLPEDFVHTRILELGKSPGLGIQGLHKDGITGKGVGVAVIDQGLLADHIEYKDRLRLYEEIHCGDETSSMHGPAVASIAVGKRVGVAPGADLYYIAETHGTFGEGKFTFDFTHLARSIDRILEVNARLPEKEKIRVISISVGWGPQQKGYAEVTAAVEKAQKEGLFVVSSSLFATSGRQFAFHGLGREPLADPEPFRSYGPGLWWTDNFYSGRYTPAPGVVTLLVPMDSRTTAGPCGAEDYAFYRAGGWSWSIPWIAGLYALACQTRPDITPELFWKTALATGDGIEFPPRKSTLSKEEVDKKVAEIVDRQMRLFDERFGKDVAEREKAMAGLYSQATGKKVDKMSDAEFRAWGASMTRDRIAGSTKPVVLEKIVNPAKLIAALKGAR